MSDPTDSRRKNLKLTEKGSQLVESFTKIFNDIETIIVEDFDDKEKEQVQSYFERMLNNIKQAH